MTEKMLSDSKKGDVREKYDNECVFCGMSNGKHKGEQGEALHVHHIIPRSADGANTSRNLVPLCSECHNTIEVLHSRGMKEIKESIEEGAVDKERYDNMKNQRDALIDRVELLERAIRTPEFYGYAIRSVRTTKHTVVEKIGTRHRVFDELDGAVDSYNEWGARISKQVVSVDKDDIEDRIRKLRGDGNFDLELQRAFLEVK